MGKIKVAIIFGGKSAEHEVSLLSAKSVIEAIDRNKYELLLIGIDKSGKWFLNDESDYLLNADSPKFIELNESDREVTLAYSGKSGQLLDLKTCKAIDKIDVIFPVLHGTYGEDGSIQGFFKLMNIPFVGCGILASSVGMDKDVTKRLLREAGIPTAKSITVTKSNYLNIMFSSVSRELGLPMFVKPANGGSSVGVHKVTERMEFYRAIEDAIQFDSKVLIEEAIKGREIECAVLGNENPKASIPGEIMPTHSFYSYEAKYIDEHGAKLSLPAKLSDYAVKVIQEVAVKAFKAIGCEGLARVDFFIKENNELLINEINTMPGFTSISMYPKLWELSGIPFPELIDTLITLALERHKQESKLKTGLD
jgi:D-alanine-D-alanine ligase